MMSLGMEVVNPSKSCWRDLISKSFSFFLQRQIVKKRTMREEMRTIITPAMRERMSQIEEEESALQSGGSITAFTLLKRIMRKGNIVSTPNLRGILKKIAFDFQMNIFLLTQEFLSI